MTIGYKRWLPAIVGLLVLVGLVVLFGPRPDAEGLRRKAGDAVAEGRWADAEAALAALARQRAPTAEDRILRARVATARGRPEEALGELGGVGEGEGRALAAGARVMAGEIEARRHRLRSAEAYLQEALRLDPGRDQALRELIYVYGTQRRLHDLDAQFRALAGRMPLAFDQLFLWCMARGGTDWRPQGGLEELRKAVKADPEDRWSRLALAEDERRDGHFDRALATLAPLPDSDPDARAVRVRIAMDQADEPGVRALLAGGPADHPGLCRLRGRLALARKDGAEAVRHFRVALAADPDDPDVLLGLANALRLVGDQAGGDRHQKAARLRGELATLLQRASLPGGRDDIDLIRQLGAACEAVDRDAEARGWYALIIRRDPLDAGAQRALFRLKPTAPGPRS
jgi:tetratricopeptide (TPR) repeat protein